MIQALCMAFLACTSEVHSKNKRKLVCTLKHLFFCRYKDRWTVNTVEQKSVPCYRKLRLWEYILGHERRKRARKQTGKRTHSYTSWKNKKFLQIDKYVILRVAWCWFTEWKRNTKTCSKTHSNTHPHTHPHTHIHTHTLTRSLEQRDENNEQSSRQEQIWVVQCAAPWCSRCKCNVKHFICPLIYHGGVGEFENKKHKRLKWAGGSKERQKKSSGVKHRWKS